MCNFLSKIYISQYFTLSIFNKLLKYCCIMYFKNLTNILEYKKRNVVKKTLVKLCIPGLFKKFPEPSFSKLKEL